MLCFQANQTYTDQENRQCWTISDETLSALLNNFSKQFTLQENQLNVLKNHQIESMEFLSNLKRDQISTILHEMVLAVINQIKKEKSNARAARQPINCNSNVYCNGNPNQVCVLLCFLCFCQVRFNGWSVDSVCLLEFRMEYACSLVVCGCGMHILETT